MGSPEDAELVRRGYAAFSAGDIPTLSELFAEDAVWHVPGSNSLSGTKTGRGAIMAFFGELATRSGGTVRVEVQDVIGGEDHTIGLHHNHAERNDKVTDQDAVLVFTIRDGHVTEVQEFHEDTARSDEFWD
jgi:ketosteroid isomerase-like protein